MGLLCRSKSAAIDGVPYTQETFYDLEEKYPVFDVCYPAVLNGENIGALSIGYRMDNTKQAKETEQGVLAISHLGDLVIENKKDVVQLNSTTEKVNNLKDQGLEMLEDLVEKSNINTRSAQEIQRTIENTNERA